MNKMKMTTVMLLRAGIIVILADMYYCQSKTECGRNCVFHNRNMLICTDVPECLPDGITNVEVNDTTFDPVVITSTNFSGRNWDKVINLRIVDQPVVGNRQWVLAHSTFESLTSVTQLHINIIFLNIDDNCLEGLPTVKVLDFTGCQSLNIVKLRSLLRGPNKIMGLQKIVLSFWNLFEMPYDFDDLLIDVLLPRNITDVDLSHSRINLLNFTTIVKRMSNLKSFNVSYASTSYFFIQNLPVDGILPVEIFDITHWELQNPLVILPVKYVFNNETFYWTDGNGLYQILFKIANINATGLIKKPAALWVNNVTLIPTKNFHFRIKELEFKENSINRFDMRLKGGNITLDLEYLGLSNNQLEYLHYSILSCMPNLLRLDLSRNRLYLMDEEDSYQFAQLLSGLPALTYINLSNNNLANIPHSLFRYCQRLNTIDLSYNELTQVTFTVVGLRNLRLIKLQNNIIHSLDAASLQNLKSFNSYGRLDNQSRIMNLASNPISCSKCESKQFLGWLLTTKLVDITSQGLYCIDEHGNKAAIDQTTLSAVNAICTRTTIIISLSISVPSVLILAIVVLVVIYKRRTRSNLRAHRRAVIDKIRQGRGAYKFIVFLSYCSKDDVFATEHVLEPLKDNLRVATGLDPARNPVCTGDQHLRPGFYVHNEVDARLDEASVVVVLATENYCNSDFCGSELEKAFMKKKPTILMFKEHVREELMSRTMKDIYKRNVRILWTEENGQYKLQTTWDNICTSIIDLIQ